MRLAPEYKFNRTERPPLWRSLARRVPRAFYRLVALVERMTTGGADTLMPPAHLRVHYYRTVRRAAFSRACEGAQKEVLSWGLRPDDRVLDIGSGIGNLAVGLVGFLKGQYDGVEISAEAVAWCRRAITSRYPSFRFHHADLVSQAYNPRGRLSAANYAFPFPDQRFDFIFLGSVFTHMLPDAVEQYIHEIAHVLAPGGVCVASYFLLNDDNRSAVNAGRSFISFHVKDRFGLCLLHKVTVPEAAIAIEESFVRRVCDEAGVQIRNVRRGKWWIGEADDQDVVAITTAGI